MAPEDIRDGMQIEEKYDRENTASLSEPAFMYVHYLSGHSENNRYPMYLFQMQGSDLAGELRLAIDDIIAGMVTKIPRNDADLQEWRVYSYIVFVLRNQEILGLEFLDENRGNGSYCIEEIGPLPEYRNHYSMAFLNKRIDKHGNPLSKWDDEKFAWKIARHERNHESSTTNTGP